MQQQAMHIANNVQRQQRHTALLARGSSKNCPQCGKGPLLTGYWKLQASCSACKEDFSQISANDGLAWLTSLIGIYFILPRAKGVFIVLIWLRSATGQNEFYDSPELKD